MHASPNREAIEISDEELKSLTDVIHSRHGIDFSTYEPKSLKRRILRALHVFDFPSVCDLWMYIQKERMFIYEFMDVISVGLTSMFRDPQLWQTLRQMLEKEWRTKAGLNIWHAGCSTGEEVYSMGIVLKEANFKGEFQALATDISNLAISKAKLGEYSLVSKTEYERNYLEYNPTSFFHRHCASSSTGLKMNEDIINHVTFMHHNLITDPFRSKFDIIFCRNVMIYFDNGAKKMLFEKFYEALNPGGLLVIGFYDAVLPIADSTKFKVLDMNAKIFVKD